MLDADFIRDNIDAVKQNCANRNVPVFPVDRAVAIDADRKRLVQKRSETAARQNQLSGQFKNGRRAWLPHVGLAAFEMASLAMTDPSGKGDFHGDVEAVRKANTESPHRKIYEGPRAVRVANAV